MNGARLVYHDITSSGPKKGLECAGVHFNALAPPVVPGLKEEAAQSWILANREMEGNGVKWVKWHDRFDPFSS